MGREAICLDSYIDKSLLQKVITSRQILADIQDKKTKVTLLAAYVCSILGGYQISDDPGTHIYKLSELNVTHILNKTKLDYLPLGMLDFGVCRHRALMFKYLADRNRIPTRLVRGKHGDNPDPHRGLHVWNVVELNGELYIVDVMNDPTRLRKEGSPDALQYRRKTERGFLGGFGGKSIGR
jgi:hypothetical protein